MSVTRHLASVLAIEIDAYSQLMAADEEFTHERLKEYLRELVGPRINQHHGRLVKNTGDRMLAEFSSVVDAVRSAAEIQYGIADRNATTLPERRIVFRMGITAGDVIAEPEDIYGDQVNVAARLGSLAEPGAICVSALVYDEVRDRLPYAFADIGEQFVKNIARPIRVYMLHAEAIARVALSGIEANQLPQPTTTAPRFSIVVLPFTDLSEEAGQQYFADGITEDLTTDLCHIPDLLVISRYTAMTYRGRSVATKQIGRELGVRFVMEGSVRRSGEALRIGVRLVDVETDSQVWAEHYDLHEMSLFDLQDAIVRSIVGAIEPELLKFERERIATRPHQSGDVYDLYQRGMFHHYRQNKADNLEAQAYFRRALATDPQYTRATVALSIALSSAAMIGWVDDTAGCFEQAYELAERAAALDRRYPNSHFALGLACMWTRRSAQAIGAFREAIALNPNFAAAHVLLGQMHLYAGRPEEAIGQAERGIRLSPNDPRLFIWLPTLSGAHYMLRNYAEAVEAGYRSWLLNSNWPHGLRYAVAGLGQLGRIQEAQPMLASLRRMDPYLESSANILRRVYPDPTAVEHILDGLRKAGLD